MRTAASTAAAIVAAFLIVWAALAVCASLVTGEVVVWPWMWLR